MASELDPAPTSYAAAVEELEEILDAVESDTIDVDVLADRVRRAAALLRWCRGRVLDARSSIEDAAADLVEDA